MQIIAWWNCKRIVILTFKVARKSSKSNGELWLGAVRIGSLCTAVKRERKTELVCSMHEEAKPQNLFPWPEIFSLGLFKIPDNILFKLNMFRSSNHRRQTYPEIFGATLSSTHGLGVFGTFQGSSKFDNKQDGKLLTKGRSRAQVLISSKRTRYLRDTNWNRLPNVSCQNCRVLP